MSNTKTALEEFEYELDLEPLREKDSVELTLTVLFRPERTAIARQSDPDVKQSRDGRETDYVVQVSTPEGDSFDTVLECVPDEDSDAQNGYLSCIDRPYVPVIEPMGELMGHGIPLDVAEEIESVIENHQQNAVLN